MEPIPGEDHFYILAGGSRAGSRTQVLKQGETFAIFDIQGEICARGIGEQGLYHEGTRFLSRLDLRLDGGRPFLLSSTVRDYNDVLAVDLTNPDVHKDREVLLPRGTLHLFRSKFLWQGACYERVRVHNHGLHPVEVSLSLEYEADFADIFEVRGTRRARRGQRLAGSAAGAVVSLPYLGLDGVMRRTRLEFEPAPQALSAAEARYQLHLEPKGSFELTLVISCQAGAGGGGARSHGEALQAATAALAEVKARLARVHTSNVQLNAWIRRSVADAHMMITELPTGPYPYAGVPWFSTVFGRDGIITALELLWLDPGLARGVLTFLARSQARELDPVRDAEPGKILHETRRGEMADLGEIPFGRYYGSVDSTPLFVLLAGAYYQRTGDLELIRSIWPEVQAALDWMDRYGDVDGDGFVEYSRHSPRGLLHQGWKDSHDAVFHQDGSLAEGPIALCEVQAYVYAARRGAAELASLLGDEERAEELRRQAEELRENFDKAFWCEDLSTYALALDGGKRPCRVRTSNAGQCLFTGIVPPERARRVGRLLLETASFSGWGIRTVAATEARFNPMSYHNGSVWPHDNALIALGLARCGMREQALQVFEAQFDATTFLDLHRLPELFCGFPRRDGEGPTLYPVACTPQAWSSAAVFLLLEALLGLTIDGRQGSIQFYHPVLPESVKSLEILGLQAGSGRADLLLERHRQSVSIQVLHREGDVQIVAVK